HGAHVKRRDSPITRWLQGAYTALLSRIVHRPRRAYAAFIAPTLIAVIIAPHLGTSLFPEFREPDFLIHFITTPGTSAVEQQRMIVRLSGDLRSIPGVRSFGSHIGQAFLGDEIEELLAAIPGIKDDHVDLQLDTPQVQVEVDLAKAAAYGLKPGDVRRAASTMVAGEEVGDIFRDGKAYDVMVWSTPETRSNVASISDLPIDTPSGSVVRLGDIANVTIEPEPNVIERENGSRRIDVAANVSGRDLGSAA